MMKKILNISILFLIFVMLTSTTLVKSDYMVTIGSDFIYDVVESSQTVTVGEDTGGGEGFQFEEEAFNVGEQIFVEVIDASTTQIDFNVTVGNASKIYHSSGIEDSGNFYYDLQGPLHYLNSLDKWVQAEVDAGPPLFCDYFINPSFSNGFLLYTNETRARLTFSDTAEITFTKIAGNFDNSSTIAEFDWVLEFEMKNTTANTDFEGKYLWKYAYDKSTGVVQGWKVAMECSGTILGLTWEFIVDQTVEIEGYNIGEFYYTSKNGFEWLIAIPALAVVVGVMAVKRKRK
ncbi:MAG: choice-of-anchor S family protein [Candidatus Heimdallarchaeota archaeon]